MIVVTAEVREVTPEGSRLIAAATDVPGEHEAVAITLFRVAALAGAEVEQMEDQP